MFPGRLIYITVEEVIELGCSPNLDTSGQSTANGASSLALPHWKTREFEKCVLFIQSRK